MRKIKRIALALLLAGVVVPSGTDALAGKEEVELADAAVFIEWNFTDTDFGIHFFWDGVGWEKMKVRDDRGKTVLQVKTSKNVKAQSLTEAMFESREPPASELSMEQFFDRFPEGTYAFKGKSFDGNKLVGEADFAHTLPAPTTITSPTGGSTQSADGFTFSWTEVTQDIDGNDITVEGYVVVIESTSEDPAVELELFVPFGTNSLDIPGEFITPDNTYKAEVIVIDEESGNRTIRESGEFSTDSGS